MKELIYRRESGGFETRCADGVSAANRHRGTQYSLSCMNEADENSFCYRQLRMDDGTIATGASYLDPRLHGNRRSTVGHIIFAQAGEVEALLDSYPSSSKYFSLFREELKKNEQLHSQPAEMEIPMRAYLYHTKGGLECAPAILRAAFHTPESLSAMFEALLDAASSNARMVVIFGQEEASAQSEKSVERQIRFAEQGRAIIEALFACLPNVLVRYMGYISPAAEDKDNALFCVRYSRPREISASMSPHTYTFNIAKQEFKGPTNANHAAKEYADELAGLVFRADAAAFARIRTLKKQLDDAELYDVKNVPASLILRYRFYNDARKLSNEDIRDLLDWYIGAVDAAEKNERDLDQSAFWGLVDRWVIEWLLPQIYACSASWKDTDPVFSSRRVREIYGVGQRLHRMGRAGAAHYQKYFDGRLGSAPMLDASSENTVTDQLLDFMLGQLKDAQDANIGSKVLYWQSIERWLLDAWNSGHVLNDQKALEVVDCIYRLDRNRGAAFMEAYARDCVHRAVSPLKLIHTSFSRAVYQNLLKRDVAYVTQSMHRDLDGKDPCTELAVLKAFLNYRKMVGGTQELQDCYLAICADSRKKALNGIGKGNIETAFEQLKSSAPDSVPGVYDQLDPTVDMRALMEKRIVEVLRNMDIYAFYPEKASLAAEAAELLDRDVGGRQWSTRIKKLEEVNRLQFNEMDEGQFHQLMEDDFGARNDRGLAQKCKAVLWKNICRSFGENAADNRALLMALALYSNNDGYFNPRDIMRGLEELNIEPKKFLSFCKKQVRSEPDALRGLAYVAAAVLDYDSGELKRGSDQDISYPGMPRERRREETREKNREKNRTKKEIDRESPKEEKSQSTGMFAGVPSIAAAVMVVAGASGLAASLIGLLNSVGLI